MSKTIAEMLVDWPSEEKPHRKIEVDVRQQDGGVSFIDGKSRSRGLYVSFHEMEVTESAGGFTSKSFMLFDPSAVSMGFLIQRNERLAPKRAAELVEFVKANLEKLTYFAKLKDWPNVDQILTTFPGHDRHAALV